MTSSSLHHTGYRYRLDLSAAQEATLTRWAGCCRFVFNRGLALREATYKETGKGIGYAENCKALTALKRVFDWLRDPPVDVLQQALKDLDTAYKRFFNKLARYPRFRSRHHWMPSMRLPQRGQLKVERLSASVGRLNLPKIGWVRFRWSRAPIGAIRSVTLSRDACGRWHVAILCRTENHAPGEPSVIEAAHFRGLDVGIARSVTDDTGDHAQAPTPTREDRRHTAKLARRVSRKVKGSKNRGRAQLALNRFRARWMQRRKDSHHKLSTKLIRENQGIAIEDLKINHMTRRAKGKRVRQKAGLNRSILSQGWGSFRTKLEWKAAKAGVIVERVEPAYTSQTCSACGVVDAASRRSQAAFVCTACGASLNADHNAARNIRAAGLSSLKARGVRVRPAPASVGTGGGL